jgi:hypothetical protein
MLLEAAALSAVAPAPIRFVFASSVAACVSATQGVDGPLDSPVRLVASSSYGTHKGIGTPPFPPNGPLPRRQIIPTPGLSFILQARCWSATCRGGARWTGSRCACRQ